MITGNFKKIMVLLLWGTCVLANNFQIFGAIKSAMQGDISAKYNLNELKDSVAVFGLGAIENLKGEIIIIDSRPYLSMVKNNKVVIDSTWDHKAAILGFTTPDNWLTTPLSVPLNIQQLDSLLNEKTPDQNGPFLFTLEGTVQQLDWHVIDWPEGDTVHTHQKHKAAGLHGKLENEQVTIVGIYSKNHRGIITHKTSNLHLHFLNKDKTLAGHVDNLVMKNGIFKLGIR